MSVFQEHSKNQVNDLSTDTVPKPYQNRSKTMEFLDSAKYLGIHFINGSVKMAHGVTSTLSLGLQNLLSFVVKISIQAKYFTVKMANGTISALGSGFGYSFNLLKKMKMQAKSFMVKMAHGVISASSLASESVLSLLSKVRM